MKKMIFAAAIVLGASVSQAFPGEITIVVCQQPDAGFDHGVSVELSHDIKGKKDILLVSQMWIGGTRNKSEVAVIDKSQSGGLGGGLTYVSDSYVFSYNGTTSPSAGFYSGSLTVKANNVVVPLRCNFTR